MAGPRLKYLIFSDSHGSDYAMREVIRMHAGSASGMLFAGDGCQEFEWLGADHPAWHSVAVAGNYEEILFSGSRYETETLVPVGPFRIFLTHGHHYHVKYSESEVIRRALDLGADAVIYGHTHEAVCYRLEAEAAGRDRPLWVFNPGSISRPRESRFPTFGILDVRSELFFTAAEFR